MAKTFILSCLVFFASICNSQTATNFTCNDCAGNPHTLFNEIDAGKVIVICWVMPCGLCINGASTVATTVQGFASTNPGQVKLYFADDYANTNCATLTSWLSTNGITAYDAAFSNAVIDMFDYGTAGMPKVVVLGGPNHTVFLNQDNNFNSSAIQTAIQNAINASVGITENIKQNLKISLFPNPAVKTARLNFSISYASSVTVSVYTMLGERILNFPIGKQSPGKQEYQINIESLKEGIYFIKVSAGESSETMKLTVTH